MANKHMNRYLRVFVVREIQIKTTRRYHFTPIRMATIKKSNNKNFWRGRGKIGKLTHCQREYKMMQPLSNNSTPKCVPRRNENIWQIRTMYTNVYSSTIHNGQEVETTQMPVN